MTAPAQPNAPAAPAAQPLVTMGVMSYNNARYLGQTLDSTIQEGYANRELVVVDDCSTDNSVEVINDWVAKNPHQKVKVIVHERNKGICSAANSVLKVSSGKYLAIIGSDDVFMPDKLTVQVPLLENASEKVAVVYSEIQMIGPAGEMLPTPADWVELHQGNVFLPVLKRNFIPAMSTLVRRSCLDAVGIYDESLSYEDWDMWLRLSEQYEFIFSEKISAHYRIHVASAMYARKVVMMDSTLRMLLKHWGKSPAGDEIIKWHVRDLSEQLFQHGHDKAGQWLKVRWDQNRDIRSLIFLLSSRMGIPGGRIQQLQRLLHRQ